ncbi:MAG: AsmA-like C-terminal region-containing protein [Burkholderiales bacterium]|nr:AsmA-like C-terminal region-containing protein [Burkholderiales bacterium]
MGVSRRVRLAAWCAAAALLVALAVPYVVPLGSYLQEIEQTAGTALGQPVKVEALRLHLLPRPHVTAYRVTVGQPAVAGIDAIVVRPKLSSLLSDTRVIADIRVVRPWIEQAGFAVVSHLASAPRKTGGGPPAARVEQVRITDAELRLAAGAIGSVNATILLDDKSALQSVELTQAGGRLKAILRPTGRAFALDVTARDWLLPVVRPLKFDRIDAKAALNANGLSVRSIDARLYDGSIAGDLRLGWKGGWKLDGKFTVTDVSIAPLTAAVGAKPALSGRIKAKPVLSAAAGSAGGITDALHVDTDFEITQGVLKGLDLNAAARSVLGSTDAKNGDTKFDQLTGRFAMDPAGYHFSDLEISSGFLKATGDVTISKTKELSGDISAEVRGTASLIATPLSLSGTVDDPVVRPSKAALAGAAVGTAILPGVGTAIGARAGEFTKKLFGGSSRKRVEESSGGR